MVVAFLLVVSGCNGLGGVTGDSQPAETLTPAPVPSAEPTPTRALDEGECVAPRPAAQVTTPTATADGRQTWAINGTIQGSELVERHERILPRYDYQLRAGTDRRVWSLRNHTTFAYESGGSEDATVTAYAVGGRLYELYNSSEGTTLVRGRYHESALRDSKYVASLTGEDWLEGVIGSYPYRMVGTKTWRGMDVRVLNTTVFTYTFVDRKYLLEIESTVYVDRRGVIRYVDHYERYTWDSSTLDDTDVVDTTFTVTDLDPDNVTRPSAFCELNPAAVGVVDRTHD